LVTNGAPSPVEIPDNNSTDNAYLGLIRLVTKYITTGMMITFRMDNIKRNLGFLKIEMRSWKSSWIKFRNNKRPRIIKMYGEKSSPVEGNKIPSIVEIRIEIASTNRIFVS
jgi:hypothetical protein